MSMNNFITLISFSFFSLNLVLKFGLGAKEISENHRPAPAEMLFQWAVMFITVFVSWLIFTSILSPLSLGFFEYFMLFPITVFVTFCFEKLLSLLLPAITDRNGMFQPYTAYSGLVLTALMLTLRAADTARDALVLSCCFSSGAFFAIMLLGAVRLRGKNEKVLLSEKPLLLLSIALLSLVFSSIAYIAMLKPLSF
jgi:Na+-translocating ferredoxin:NAD+ oxidoreductase RnfA subunit